MINILALLLAAGFVDFMMLLAPLSVARPVSLAALGVILASTVVVIVRKIYLARRSASRDQPHA
ncbi:hypothetical protein AB0J35_51610 [Nonomuraea angiospora]|uniref:hypothetical protein n=1 Tax=Nonomuraea angiospora TaxID=46172 RepID=UPI0034185626